MRPLVRRHWMTLLIAAVFAVYMVPTAYKLFKRIWTGSIDDGGLSGMSVSVAEVPFTYDNFLNGKLQKYVEDQLAKSVPLRKPSIRWFNQAWFDLFGSSYMYSGTILKGRDGQLFERVYLEAYCLNDFDAASERQRIEDWAATVARLQEWAHARGKAFVYLITPNKVIYLPEYLPSGYRCGGPVRERYRMMVEALQRQHIDYIDGSKIVLDLKPGATFPYFPRGGTHWTVYPAAVVGNALIAEASRQAGVALPPLEYTYRLVSGRMEYDGYATDLADLLNLKRYRRYESERIPVWDFGRQKTTGETKLSAVVVGGSFNVALLPVVSDAGAFEPIEFYFYTTLAQFHYSGGRRTTRTNEGPDLRSAIAAAQVLILEENEASIVSHHGKLLVDQILGSTIK